MLARTNQNKAEFIFTREELYELATELHYLECYANKESKFIRMFADILVELKDNSDE